MRIPALSVLLCFGGAFLVGGGLARLSAPTALPDAVEASEVQPAPSVPASRSFFKSGRGSPPTIQSAPDAASSASAFPGIADPQVLAALQNPDLIAAVREIMARSEEDHCADTRLIQLIESFPQSCLAELPALLAANSDNDYVLRFVLTPWAERQPEAALAWAGSQTFANATLLTSVLTGWTRRDPTAALEWTLTQPLSTNTRALQTSLIETLAEADPARALAVLNDTGWINTNSRAVLKLLKNWGSQDPTAAMTGLRGMIAGFGIGSKAGQSTEDPSDLQFKNQFNGLLGALLNGAGSRSAADVTALLRQLTPQETEAGADSIARDFLMIHPEAVQALLANPNPGATDKSLLLMLAKNGSGNILENVSRFHDPAFRFELLSAISSEAFIHSDLGVRIGNSKTAQTALLQALAETGEAQRGWLVRAFTENTADSAPGLATQLWGQLNHSQQQQEGTGFFLGLAKQTPGPALEIWRASPPDVQAQSLRGLVAGLARKDPQRGVALAMQQSDPELRHNALAVALAHWGEHAPQAAAAELARLAPQLDLDAMNRFLSGAGRFDSGSRSEYYSLRNQAVQDCLKSLIPTSRP